MAQLAIKGHATRGSEVIALLEMLGGINAHNLYGDESYAYYTIDSDNEIKGGIYVFGDEDLLSFTLEEFLEKYPYKVGDKVITDDGDKANIVGMIWDNDIDDVFYDTQICNEVFKYHKELLQPFEEKESMETAKITITPQYHWNKDKIEIEVTKDYEIKEENGKYYAVKKQYKYPKTFIGVLNFWHPNRQLEDDYQRCYKKDLIEKLQDLLYARAAYWKIAGEQMGLGKPWEPDYNEESYEQGSQKKYVIYYTGTHITKGQKCTPSYILAFPTAEIRDAFYENFKELIENVKELL